MCAVDFKGGRKKAARECVRSTSENVRSCRLDESFLFLLLGGETDHPWRKLRVGVSENTRSASVKCETNRGGGRKKKEKKRFLFFSSFCLVIDFGARPGCVWIRETTEC